MWGCLSSRRWVSATYFREPVGNILSNIPFVGALFSGPARLHWHSGGGRHPRHHDHPLHCGGYARRLRANAGNDERVRLRYRLYHRSYLAHRATVLTKNGVIGGIMLLRALGETMAVTFIIGNTHQLDTQRASLYSAGQQHHFRVGNEFAEANRPTGSADGAGADPFVITIVLRAALQFMIMRLAKNGVYR